MRATNPGFVPDSPFTRPLPEAWTDFFSRFPKAELHCHLLGTITKSTFEDLVRLSGAPVTQEEIDGFFTRGDKPVGVLRIFRALEAHILSRPEFLERIANEHTVAVSRLGVRYIEYFWNSTGLKHFYSFDEGQKAIIRGLKRAEAECGTVGRLIPSIDREDTPEEAVFMVEEMIRHPMPETLGIGIDYRETGHEPENFWKAYRLAKKAGLHITAHAGEFGEHWRNVETAMDLLEVERVDHGYTITDNPALMEEARRSNLIFTVVPTNSYYLRTFTDEEWAIRQPIRKMVEAGLCVFPNSDDPTMHHVNAAESWLLMFNWLGFDLPALRGMVENSIDAAWVSDEQKALWKKEWLAEFDRLAQALPPLPER